MDLRAHLILEVLGKPHDHVYNSLDMLKNSLSKEEKVEVVSAFIGEPKEIKDAKGFYTGFLDVEILVERIEELLGICFKYMPAYIELIYPEKISFSNGQLNELITTIISKLHGYDEVARVLSIQKDQLEQELLKLRESVNKKENK